jgi:hypothetical protein
MNPSLSIMNYQPAQKTPKMPSTSIQHRVSRIQYPETGIQPEISDRSGSPVKADGHLFTFNNYRNFSAALGVLQHAVKMPAFFDDIQIIKRPSLFGKSFTSCPRIGSSVLSKNQNFISHLFSSHGGNVAAFFPTRTM